MNTDLCNPWLKPSLRFYSACDDRFTNTVLCAIFGRLLIDQLNVETERLKLAYEHVERLRQTWIEVSLAFYDRLVDLGATSDVVRLSSQQLLENVRRAVSFERPHLHLSEALSTKLRLTAQRLLRDQAVRSN